MIFNSAFINKLTHDASYNMVAIAWDFSKDLGIGLLPWEFGKKCNNLTICWELAFDLGVL